MSYSSSRSRLMTDSDVDDTGSAHSSSQPSLGKTPSNTTAEIQFLRSSLGITSQAHLSKRLKKKKHSIGSGNLPRGARGSSTTTNMELLGEIRSHNSSRPRVFSDNRTEFGSFKSADVSLRTRSMRVDSENSKPSTTLHIIPNRQSQAHTQNPIKRRGKNIGDFMIGDLLGEGSYARVHVCRFKPKEGTLYALKIMDKKEIKKEKKASQVSKEMKALGSLNCLNIIKLWWCFQDENYLYMVTEICLGGDLDRVLKHFSQKSEFPNRSVPMDRVKFYIAETTAALQFIHHNGLIHRDIKPDNILISNDGHVKLADFGCVKSEKVTDEKEKKIQDRDLVGSPNYVSPEMLESLQSSTGADLWALGVLVYHLIVGSPPFRGETTYLTFEKISAHSNENYIHIPTVSILDEADTVNLTPDELIAQDLINKLLRKEPEERLGAANNCTPAQSNFDKKNNQPRLLREHGFFSEVDFSMLSMAPAPPVVTPIEVDEPRFDGNDKQWTQEGVATDIIYDTFKKESRKRNESNIRPHRVTTSSMSVTGNRLSTTLHTMDINPTPDPPPSVNNGSMQLRRRKGKSFATGRGKAKSTIREKNSKQTRTKKTKSKKYSNFGISQLMNRQTLSKIKTGMKKTIRLDDESRKNRSISTLSDQPWMHYEIGDYSILLEEGEEVVEHGAVRKRNGLFYRPRILVLTSKPRFVYFNAETGDRKGEIGITEETECTLEGDGKAFKVICETLTYRFVDCAGDAARWRKRFLREKNQLGY